MCFFVCFVCLILYCCLWYVVEKKVLLLFELLNFEKMKKQNEKFDFLRFLNTSTSEDTEIAKLTYTESM